MKISPHPANVAEKISVHSVHFEPGDDLRKSLIERASRFFDYNPAIAHIRIDLEEAPGADVDHRFVAKAHIEFGGPALFASIAASDVSRAIDYLFEKIDHQLRRQRYSDSATFKRNGRPSSSQGRPIEKL